MRPRANIGRRSTNAQVISARRAAESETNRVARRENNRVQVALSRGNLTEEDNDEIRRQAANRVASNRSRENEQEREARLDGNRQRSARRRQDQDQDEDEDLHRLAFNYDPTVNFSDDPTFSIGLMDNECQYCGALKYANEAPGMCCSNGKVRLPPLAPMVEPLRSLTQGDTPMSKRFLARIRKYNSAFQMTSFGATKIMDNWSTFKVRGQVYHRIGSLLPTNGQDSQFLQIYFIGDSVKEAARRMQLFDDLDPQIVLQLQQFLHQNNAYIQMFKTAIEMLPSPEHGILIRPDRVMQGDHPGRYNAPTAEDVAVVMVNSECAKRDIVIRQRDDRLQKICETHRSYDALQYPLMFWTGDDGYNFDLKKRDGTKMTCMEFYAYRIMIRIIEDNYLLKYGHLFLQYLVDMIAKILSERLLYIQLNQTALRVENYAQLRDSIMSDGDANNLGKKVILPSTVVGSPRNMHEFAQDGLVYVRKYGCPDNFITFTCNPNWKEIQELLLPGQTAVDRPDICARVFKQKLALLMKLIVKDSLFGKVRCHLYTIEYQKRGLPHAHLLFWLLERSRPEDIDSMICAEIPDPELDPELYELVTRHMIHGPCGILNPKSPCMVDGKCSKKFPKQFCTETQTNEDGFPKYRRRSPEDGGFTFTKHVNGNECVIDNRWVVPYNPVLLKIFRAHINVEWCHSVKCIKYVCKYVCKGPDQLAGEVRNERDEIECYINGRYISSCEAVWRILGFPIHERYPTVMTLEVHLENGQRLYFKETSNLQNLLDNPPRTQLTAFFHLCSTDTFARTIFYPDVARYYRWEKSTKSFKRRAQGQPVQGYPGVKSCDALGRVYTVHPSHSECFYLRMLLHVVPGPTSFTYLKTVEGTVCETFRQACELRGMLESDAQWKQALEEASVTSSAQRVRHLFAIILTTCFASNPKSLWDEFKETMSEDIVQARQRRDPLFVLSENAESVTNEALIRLEDICLRISGKGLLHWGLDSPNRTAQTAFRIEEEEGYNLEQLTGYVQQNEPLLVNDQKVAYDRILDTISRKNGGLIFLDAPGGTGKTFLLNLLLSKVRSEGKVAVAVASSGIAATLLQGGRTAHSAFKLPFNLQTADSEAVCNVSKGSSTAKILEQCDLIIWDECAMSHKRALEALNNTMKDIRSSGAICGGCVVVLAGDFRQILPVITRGTPADQINACLKSSHLWSQVTKVTLSTNMRTRLSGDTEAQVFSSKLLTIGNGTMATDCEGKIDLSDSALCQSVESEEMLIAKVYPNFLDNYTNIDWICQRAILASKVDNVHSLNLKIQNSIPGEARIYSSIDTVMDPDQVLNFPVEFLNSINPPGLPLHTLELKVGSMVILMRNMDPPKLCNGTRLLITNLSANLIEAIILSKAGKGETVFIPRIPLIPTDCPVEFKRLQFPVQLAFAMTINKAQGQTFEIAGVHLFEGCFTHGQLYVAFSRVGSSLKLFVFAQDKKTKNIVFKNVL